MNAGDLEMIGGKRVYSCKSLVQPINGQRFGTRRRVLRRSSSIRASVLAGGFEST